MDDTTLLKGFENGSLPLEQWDHQAHIKVAYLYIQRHSLYGAIDAMRSGLQRFIAAKQIATGPDQGYHETITQSWLHLVFAMMANSGPFECADAFCQQHAHLLNKRSLLYFYSRDKIMSLEARQKFLPPDLTKLPAPPAPNGGCLWTTRKQQARIFAQTAHGAQAYGDQPYVFHLDAVANLLSPYGEDAVVLGYLHDILEDTPCTEAELIPHFGETIATCAQLLTDCPGKSRKERKDISHKKLAAIELNTPHTLALVVKTADRLANMRQCCKDENHRLMQMYQREFEAFRKAVWRPNLALSLWDELDQLYTHSLRLSRAS